ncbi:MAG: D-glycerate dehydrogenase [Gammaproteobacteria bacterium]|nr:D-glycerate dehydrogenase [Gammaproteobacteria bacterium]
MNKPKVVVTRSWPTPCEAEIAKHFDAELNLADHPFTADELSNALKSADALFPTVTDRVTRSVLDVDSMQAKLIANFGVGFNHIDLEAAKEHGLVVTNTPEVLTDCTADLAMALLLAVARRVGEGERELRAGNWTGWRPTHMTGTKVTGKTLGVVGFGRIGQAVARRAHHGFGMTILFHDAYKPHPDAVRAVQATSCDSLEELLARSDFVSLHCPATLDTVHLMNAERLAQMQPHAFLINTARGDVIHEADLIKALNDNQIAGAGLDVFEKEPQIPDGLLALDKVVLLPHLGSASMETRVAMGMKVVENARAFFEGKPPPDKVA